MKYVKLDAAQIKTLNLDADDAVFFNRQLEEIDQRLFETRYPQYKFADGSILPITSNVNPGAETYTYTRYDQFGIAKIITSYAKDIPRVDIGGTQTTVKIKSMADSYAFNVQEVRAARMGNVPLEDTKAMAARRAIEQLKDRIAFNGDTEYDLVGFNATTNVTEVVLPLDAATSTSKAWSGKTPDEILKDMNSLPTAVRTATLETEEPDTMLLPTEQYELIATTPRSSVSDTTILEYFMRTSQYIKEVMSVPKLNEAGASSADRMWVYKKDPSWIRLELPVILESFPPQIKGLVTEVILHSRIASVIDYYPLARAFADGI